VRALQGVQELQNPFDGFKFPKAQEGQRFYARSGTQSRGVRRGEEKKKVEAFGNLEILPSLGIIEHSILGRSTTTIRSVEKKDLDHWFLHPGRRTGEAHGRNDLSCQIWRKFPISRHIR
jgi:hypothetical protein